MKTNESLPKRRKHPGGRPPQVIDRDRLLHRRDFFINVLSGGWEVGWDLANSRTPEQLQLAFRRIVDTSNELELSLFVRSSLINASAREIRQAKAERAKLVIRLYELSPLLEVASRELREIESVVKPSSPEQREQATDLVQEYDRRLSKFEELQKEKNRVDDNLRELENTIASQEAFFAQTELLKFITSGKYAHNPRNLAQAMAGLPEVGSWHSFQLCERSPSTSWPMRPEEKPPFNYQVFKILEKCWSQVSAAPEKFFLDLLVSQIRGIPSTEFVGQYLRTNYRFLRKAIRETDLTKLAPAAVPYHIFSQFKHNIGLPRSFEENIRAAQDERETFG